GSDRHVLRERRVIRIADAQNLPGDKAGGVVEVQRPVSGVHVAGDARGQVFAFRLVLDSHVHRALVAVQAAVNAHAAGYWRALCRDVFGAHAVLQQQAVAGVDVGAVVNFQQGGARVGAAGERGAGAAGHVGAVEIDLGEGGVGADHARDEEAAAAVGEEAFDGVGQRRAVAAVDAVVEIAAKFADKIGEAGDEGRHVHRTALGDADHARRARTDPFDGLVAGGHLFQIYTRRKILRHRVYSLRC